MTDENRNVNTIIYTYYDKAGNKVAEKIGSNKPTVYKYDSIYRLSQAVSPAGIIKSYYYDSYSNLSRTESPADAGTTQYKYDKLKRLRFTMNSAANPAERGIIFTKYDALNRIIGSGLILTNTGYDNLYPDYDYGQDQNIGHFENIKSDTANFVEMNMYDVYRKSGVFAQMPDPFSWLQNDANSSRNLKGKLVATAFRDKPGQGWNYKIYLYDQLGRVTHMYVKFSNQPWKFIYKETDNVGNIKREFFYKIVSNSTIGEQFTWYSYDNLGRLKDVRTSPLSDYNVAKIEANYTYNKSDQCSTLTYNQVTNSKKLTTFGYDQNRGWLKNIANGNGNFNDSLGFYNNGTVKNQLIVNGATGGLQNLTYSYDSMNRLLSVTDGYTTVESFQYYDDGNLKYRGFSGNGINYYYNGNKLSSINYNGSSQSYGYDYKGNLTYDQRKGVISIEYDQRNLPLSIRNNVISNYRYDDCGHRIYKESNGKKEYYLTDDRGVELAVYNALTDKLNMINLYGLGRIGRIDVSYNTVWDDIYEVTFPLINGHQKRSQ